MPSLWRTPLNAGCPSSHRPQSYKPPPVLLKRLLRNLWAPLRPPRKEAATAMSPTASIRACSPLPHRGAIAIGSRYVGQQACLICGRKQSDPHHLRYLQPRALGRKVSDEFAVPLCRSHHRAVHRAGDEQAWWTAAGIDPVKVARQLWRQTRLNDPHPQTPSLAVRPETRPIASASDGVRESRSDSVVIGRANGGRTQ